MQCCGHQRLATTAKIYFVGRTENAAQNDKAFKLLEWHVLRDDVNEVVKARRCVLC